MTALSKLNCLKNNRTTMLTGLIIGVISFYIPFHTPMANAAPIYKVIDKNTGQVTFTDKPQTYEQQANKSVSQIGVTTGNATNSSSNSRSNPVNNKNNDNIPSTDSTQATELQSTYQQAVNYQLAITEPSAERAYQRPAQSIVVNVQLSPALQSGDSVHIYLDGEEVARGLNASIATIDMLPGQHSIQALVKNKLGEVINTVERTVYVIQNTTMLQNKKKLAQQLQAYQLLPWHQKMLLKLRQKDSAKPQPALTQ
ncbi:DUF4124 domain-containing protein [Psychrobacter jeotgali]|uniref:DUF4124 domain-containing protein n=1 Tax=Psychrobacter jeotgali TaxID=179010 RepID=UPI0019187756|nr:DUF4124 domain-containing protein [Psychrobacter jeotgali]